MILPDFKIDSLCSSVSEFSGMDSLEKCLNKTHFRNYPYEISYKFNSRGFRDEEWPDDLENCVWCFGDSFTKGLGQRYEHTWPKVLQTQIGCRTICVTMNGASNEWISRKIVEVANTIKPKTIIVQWSYTNRRERVLSPGEIDSDENRRIWINIDKNSTDEDDVQNTLECIERAEQACEVNETKLVHSFIPEFIKPQYTNTFFFNFNKSGKLWVPLLRKDRARDGHHYDLVTAKTFVDNLILHGNLTV
jgi:hypothetical protein